MMGEPMTSLWDWRVQDKTARRRIGDETFLLGTADNRAKKSAAENQHAHRMRQATTETHESLLSRRARGARPVSA